MTTEAVYEWIRTLAVAGAENYYCGTLAAKKDKSIGVYQLKDRRAREVAIGGSKNTLTATKGISLLVHWTRSTRDTENAALELYERITEAKDVSIGDFKVNYIQLLHNEPIDIGTDENGVCEHVIELVIYYERR